MPQESIGYRVFVYGSLMSMNTLVRVLSTANLDAASVLRDRIENVSALGYQRFCVKNAAYPAMIPQSNSLNKNAQENSVRGCLLIFSPDQIEAVLAVLDRFEGVAENLYRRAEIEVFDAKKCSYRAWTYLWGRSDSLLTQIPWDYEAFLRREQDFLKNENV